MSGGSIALLRSAPKGSKQAAELPEPPYQGAASPPVHHDTVDGCGDTGRDFEPALAPIEATPPRAPATQALPLAPLRTAPSKVAG